MTYPNNATTGPAAQAQQCKSRWHNAIERAARRPLLSAALLLGLGATAGASIGVSSTLHVREQLVQQQLQIDASRREAQRELNALAARLGELQAEANRLNALGERLTRVGQLQDGEFDFGKPVGVGGDGEVRDMPRAELEAGLKRVSSEFAASGHQLAVLESLLLDQQMDVNAVPSREPIAGKYITSGYGERADPILGGSQFHKGIDFGANVGDPVLAVADGVVSYSGDRAGYGNTVEIDHGNGYVTRYAHNSKLTRPVGQLVRAGQEIAKAGSTGRSTGAHVHFEVWQDGRVVNPHQFLRRNGVRRG